MTIYSRNQSETWFIAEVSWLRPAQAYFVDGRTDGHNGTPGPTDKSVGNATCESQKMSADQFELALQDQQLTDVTMTADACGITRDCFITVLEKPINQVRFFENIFAGTLGPGQIFSL